MEFGERCHFFSNFTNYLKLLIYIFIILSNSTSFVEIIIIKGLFTLNLDQAIHLKNIFQNIVTNHII